MKTQAELTLVKTDDRYVCLCLPDGSIVRLRWPDGHKLAAEDVDVTPMTPEDTVGWRPCQHFVR